MVRVKDSHSSALTGFEERLASLQGTIPPMPFTTLFHEIDELKRDSLKAFKDRCEEAKAHPTWNYDDEELFLKLELDALIGSVRAKQTAVIKPPLDPLEAAQYTEPRYDGGEVCSGKEGGRFLRILNVLELSSY
jgi:hypothetical protein